MDILKQIKKLFEYFRQEQSISSDAVKSQGKNLHYCSSNAEIRLDAVVLSYPVKI